MARDRCCPFCCDWWRGWLHLVAVPAAGLAASGGRASGGVGSAVPAKVRVTERWLLYRQRSALSHDVVQEMRRAAEDIGTNLTRDHPNSGKK